MTYSVKVISTDDFQERGIRKSGDWFVAVNGSYVLVTTSLRRAVNSMKKMGYDSHGNKL